MTLKLIKVERVERRWLSRAIGMSEKKPTHFENKFAKKGIFARPEWHGTYLYDSWRYNGNSWYAHAMIFVDLHIECAERRAVEGYLELYLQTGLYEKAPPVPPENWDRHGTHVSPYALAIGPLTPPLGMIFQREGLYLRLPPYPLRTNSGKQITATSECRIWKA